MRPGALDADVVDAFRADGVACLRGLLDPAADATAARGIDQVLADPGPRSLVASAPDDPGRFVEDFCRWTDVAAIAELALDPAIGAVAAQLVDATEVRLFHDHVLVKEPGTAQRTPWHQDQPYYNVAGRQSVSF